METEPSCSTNGSTQTDLKWDKDFLPQGKLIKRQALQLDRLKRKHSVQNLQMRALDIQLGSAIKVNEEHLNSDKKPHTWSKEEIKQVGAQTMTKKVNRTDAGFIIACQKLGVYPTVELRLPFVDADVSRTIIALSKGRDLASDHPTSVFHLVGTEVGIRDSAEGTRTCAQSD